MKKDHSTVVEITDTHVKVLQVKALRGKKAVSACDIRRLNNFTDEEVVQILTEIVLSKNIRPDDLTLIIPRRLTILKQMKLPSQNEMEIRKMVGLQLVNQIPYPLEDVVYDFQVISKEPGGYTAVLVIVIHKEVTDRYLKIFNNIGINLTNITVSSLGVLGWLHFQDKKNSFDGSQPLMVLNIDSAHTEVCFADHKRLLFSRSIAYGAKDLTPDQIVGILHQMELTLGIYRKENMGAEIKKILILSHLPETASLASRVEQDLKIPVQVMTTLENVLCQKNIKLNSLKDQSGLSLTVGLGFLLSETLEPINLTPQEVHDTTETKIRRRQWAQCIAMAVLAAIFGVFILGLDLYRKKLVLDEIKGKMDNVSLQAKKANDSIEFVRFFNDEFENRVNIAELVGELYRLAPPEVSFRSLNLDERGLFTIEGYAETSVSLNTFQANLLKSSMFKEVNLQFATKRRIVKLELTDFKISSQLTKGKGR